MIMPPSLQSVPDLKNNPVLLSFMVEPKLELEKVMAASTADNEEQGIPVQFLEHEIECPRCHDSMMLCSDFDNLYYVCEECDFCLYTIKK